MMKFDDSFLRDKMNDGYTKLESIRKDWDMSEEDFVDKVGNWFKNFNTSNEKKLALKVLENITYYSPQKLNTEIKDIGNKLNKILIKQARHLSDILLIVPNERGDSADMLAYLVKEWGIKQSQIKTIDEIKETAVTDRHILVAFNDTHGTGNQFVNSILKCLKPIIRINPLYVVALTITDQAIKYLKSQISNVRIINNNEPLSADKIFTHEEYLLLEELCGDVYPPHPMGYGETGLLTAYYYQCPNNTLPVIWANSETQNNNFDGYTFPWIPLFAYKPKTKDAVPPPEENTSFPFKQKTKLNFDTADLKRINTVIENWKCSKTTQHHLCSKLGKWFENFNKQEKELAIKVFTNINYLSLARTRTEIRELRNKVMSSIRRQYPDDRKSDILIVLTGDETESSYHYTFEFLRIWNLKMTQAVPLEHLLKHPYESVGKHLIYFYHTRIHKGETFITKIWNPVTPSDNHEAETKKDVFTAKKLPAKTHHVISFMLSAQTEKMLEEIKQDSPASFYYTSSVNLSKTVGEIFDPQDMKQLKAVYERKGVNPTNIGKMFMTAYYFNCPKDTLSLLWYDKFTPLFLSKK